MTPAVTRAAKWSAGVAGIITAMSVTLGALAWAGDTRYVQLEVFEIAQSEFEVRQLKRDIRRLELNQSNGNSTPADDAYLEFLRGELEDLRED